jgi:hypothetical protein
LAHMSFEGGEDLKKILIKVISFFVVVFITVDILMVVIIGNINVVVTNQTH